MNQQEIISLEVLKLLSDNKSHTMAEIHSAIDKCDINIKNNSTIVRTTLCLMTKEHIVQRVQRGVYQLPQPHKESSGGYITLMPSASNSSKFSLNILGNSHINLNGKLNHEIKTRFITIQFTDNFRKVRLIPNGSESHKFTKAGTTKNNNVCNELKKHKITLPAHYEISYNKELSTYDGILIQSSKKTG